MRGIVMTVVAYRFSRIVWVFLGLMICVLPASLSAHHSFAVYDFDTEIPFEGVVATLRFRNPHIEMTLTHQTADGETVIIEFVEGAPANMLVRRGLHPDMIQPGTRLTAIGSPRHDDPDAYFLRRIRLPDGREFE
jgi:hypothetical protein